MTHVPVKCDLPPAPHDLDSAPEHGYVWSPLTVQVGPIHIRADCELSLFCTALMCIPCGSCAIGLLWRCTGEADTTEPAAYLTGEITGSCSSSSSLHHCIPFPSTSTQLITNLATMSSPESITTTITCQHARKADEVSKDFITGLKTFNARVTEIGETLLQRSRLALLHEETGLSGPTSSRDQYVSLYI